MRNLQRGIEKGYISLSSDNSKITYHCHRDYTTSFKKPEEKVRASYFAELILDYGYPNKRIDIEVIVPRRKPEDRADIVVYEDDELKKPYLVVECKKDGITDAEFKQAIEQAFGNANSLRAKFASVIAGITKTTFDIAGFKPSEREKNVISDIPIKYGKTPKYRNEVNRDFLFYVLRTTLCLNQMLQRSSGGNYPAITPEDLKKIKVPLPPLEIQNKIAEEVKRRISEAEKLKAEANKIIESAKKQVEEMILSS